MATTYLTLVNNVLTRLRERTVSSVADNEYSQLIGIFINDAKREVEDAWDWSALRTTLTATTSADVFSYELNGSGNRIEVLNVWNDTEDAFVRYKDAKWFTEKLLSENRDSGAPMYYSFNGVSADGDTQVDLYPVPDGAYTVRFNCILRTADMSADTDDTAIPRQAIEHLAYAKAIEERGEDAGVSASSAYMLATKSLGDAISLDSNKHPEELIWRET